MFRFSLEEAKRLGMTVGVHNCDGWSTSGGPWVTPEYSMKEYVWSKINVKGGQRISVKLAQPPTVENYYRDVAVLAFPNVHEASSYVKASPTVKNKNTLLKETLTDGNPLTQTEFKEKSAITISFDAPFETDQLVILPHLVFSWGPMDNIPMSFVLSSSTDGKTFSELKTVEITSVNIPHRVEFPRTKARYFQLKSRSNKSKCAIAEFELLNGNEASTYLTGIHGLLQKSVAVKTSNYALYGPSASHTQPGIRADQIIDITQYLTDDGTLNWTAPKGEWSILRFGYTTTGFENKPATPEGTGLEIDKMDADASKIHFDAFIGKLLDTSGDMTGSVFQFILIDSWECHYQNWTRQFPEAFQARRGYDLTRWLPVLCGEVVENTEMSDAFLHDFRKTIADLIDQNYYKAMKGLCHQNQLELHAEVIYGGGNYPPLDILKSNGHADLPMLEFWARHDEERFQNYPATEKPVESFPAYSALACNKPVIGSEAYTCRAYFSESPASQKRYGDAAFCAGVNQMILHSYVHQPIDQQPLVTLQQFGALFNRNNPWWNNTVDWMSYQARAQYLLQKGEPVVDCIFYVGDQWPQRLSDHIQNELPFGYRSNPCNFDMLNKARVVDGKLSLDGAQQFALLGLPKRDSMELETLQVIEKLVQNGAVVYGPRPTRMLGAIEVLNDQEAFHQLVNALWDDAPEKVVDRKVGKGRVLWGKPVADVIKDIGLVPDLSSTTASAKEVMYIHKRTPNEEIYYVFNQTEEVLNTELLFRVAGKQPEIWQAETGDIKDQPIYVIEENQTRIPVTFKPSESFFFVFRKPNEKPHVTKVMKNGEVLFPMVGKIQEPVPLATYAQEEIEFKTDIGGSYTFALSSGKELKKNLPKPTMIELAEAKLSFDPIYKAEINPITISPLQSITELDDPAIQHFAGTLNYTLSFSIPESQLKNAKSIELNFGKFDATGTATLNGKGIGTIWNHGTRISVRELLQENNTLEVSLATTCRNRMIGDLKEYGEIKTIFTTAPTVRLKMLEASMPLKATGLLGPVTLTVY